MSFVDYIIVAVVVLAAVGALIYTHRIPPATAEPAALPARGPVPKSKRVHPMRRNKSLMKNFL